MDLSGKSCWSADPNYTGSVDEFTIYDAALTEDQVQLSDADVLQKKLEALDILGDKNESLDAVVYDLNLVKSADGFDIKWSSDNEDVITADGKVLNSDEDTQVTLTATAVLWTSDSRSKIYCYGKSIGSYTSEGSGSRSERNAGRCL